uniref:Uncharacterized protein n=1 Tax=Alexandrium monilatum TaxID=311494 RepID=A0A7S4Q7A7_9DINO
MTTTAPSADESYWGDYDDFFADASVVWESGTKARTAPDSDEKLESCAARAVAKSGIVSGGCRRPQVELIMRYMMEKGVPYELVVHSGFGPMMLIICRGVTERQA